MVFGSFGNTTLNATYSDFGVVTYRPQIFLGVASVNGSDFGATSPLVPGIGNISTDPMFVDSNYNHFLDASTANYHLKKFSPAIIREQVRERLLPTSTA